MTASVSVFVASGLTPIEVKGGVNKHFDAVLALHEPLLGRDVLSCDNTTPDSTAVDISPENARCLFVQVEEGKTVYFEITADRTADIVNADSTSRWMSGNNHLHWCSGWRLSVLEKT